MSEYRGYKIIKEWDDSHTTPHWIAIDSDGNELIDSDYDELLREINEVKDNK